MAMYLMAADADGGWGDSPPDFAQALRERWPRVEIEAPTEQGDMALSFWLDGWALGHLHGDGRAVTVDDDLDTAAEVAAWWRGRVPHDLELRFFDEACSADVAVDSGIRGPALVAAWSAAGHGES